MRDTRLIMGMPITVEIVGASSAAPLEAVFDYFGEVDARFSPFKSDSEVAGLNSGVIEAAAASEPMQEVLRLAAVTDGNSGLLRHPPAGWQHRSFGPGQGLGDQQGSGAARGGRAPQLLRGGWRRHPVRRAQRKG